MNDFFEPHKFTECTDDVMDYNAQNIPKLFLIKFKRKNNESNLYKNNEGKR